MSYVDRARALEALRPQRGYISNAEYRQQKSSLTRAVNSGDPVKVLGAVEKTLKAWEGKVWPDEWSRWRNALDDAAWAADRAGDHDLGAELHAASLVLFP